MSAHTAGGPAHLLAGFVLGAGSWAVVGLVVLLTLGSDIVTVLLVLLLAVAATAAVLVAGLNAAVTAQSRRRSPHWPGRMT